MSARKETLAEALSDREIVSRQVFGAARERMFTVWSDPDHVAQ